MKKLIFALFILFLTDAAWAANGTYSDGDILYGTDLTSVLATKAPATSGSSMLKGNGSGGFAAAVAGTDFQAPMSTLSGSLSGDVTMTNANTYYDGPSVTLTQGSWILIGHVLFQSAVGSRKATAKLWNGTTVKDSNEISIYLTDPMPVPLLGFVTVASGTEVWKIAGASTGAGDKIKAACPDNGAGNNASTLTAIKIGP